MYCNNDWCELPTKKDFTQCSLDCKGFMPSMPELENRDSLSCPYCGEHYSGDNFDITKDLAVELQCTDCGNLFAVSEPPEQMFSVHKIPKKKMY
jgi:hypothetical protein